MWILCKQRAQSEGVFGPYKWMIDNFTTSWRNFSQGRLWTPITAAFSHEDFGHILFNGFTFFFMAKPMLEVLGSRHFIFLYLGGGLIASMASMGWNNIFKNRDQQAYGASG
ncbi:hypothetical protein H0H87_001203 [Tephrocybe sp. NHM501043]|nr:hypothetical protein H0H87_001203 [Tephrocybe sp. NHM501043]